MTVLMVSNNERVADLVVHISQVNVIQHAYIIAIISHQIYNSTNLQHTRTISLIPCLFSHQILADVTGIGFLISS